MIASDEAYRLAGVDLKSAAAVVDVAKAAAEATRKPYVLGGVGGFSGAFELPPGYRQPVLLTACDGVGTKLKLAFETGVHHTVGVDLVAMSVNDLLVNGGRPLAFLDYVATGKIAPGALSAILAGVAEGCRQADCALVGGETAEMPGFYAGEEYDLAGFCVGVAEKDACYPKPERMRAGDALIGLSSSGFHSNGYSLVRKIIAERKLPLDAVVPELGAPLGEALLAPTVIYVQPVLALLAAFPDAVSAMVHVTGGGFFDNVPRVLPDGLQAVINPKYWVRPPVFDWFQSLAGLSDETMAHTFNWGVGFVLVVKPEAMDAVTAFLKQCDKPAGFDVSVIGALAERGQGDAPLVLQ